MSLVMVSGGPISFADSDAPLLAAMAEAAGGNPIRILVGSGGYGLGADVPPGSEASTIDSFFDIFTEFAGPGGGGGGATVDGHEFGGRT